MIEGTVYKISNSVDNEIYIGSTTKSLWWRFISHLFNSKNRQYQHRLLYKKMNELGIFKFSIQTVEVVKCETLHDLRLVEGKYIVEYEAKLNKNIAGRTFKEWRDVKHRCECGKYYSNTNKLRHYKTKIHNKNIQLISI